MAEKGFGVKEVNLIGASGTPTITSPNNLNLNAVNVAISTNVSVGGTLTVSGNISIGGTLTYEDVTNIDSVGIITAREGIRIGAGKSIGSDGAAAVYYGDGSQLTGIVGGAMTAYNNSNHNNVTTFIAGYEAGEDIQKQNSDGNSSIGNILIGDRAGYKAQNAYDYNIAIGPYAHDNSDGGTTNISIGRNANSNNNQNTSNVISIGYQTLNSFSNNGQNCVIGHRAARFLQSGTNNLVLGQNAEPSATAMSNEITLGDTNISHFRIPGIGVSFSEGGAVIAGVVTATSFSGSGASLTNLPAANITGTLPAISGANLTGIAVTEAPVVDYTITANGSSAYRFHGGGVDETADDPDLYLVRGQKYRFNNTTGSSHPFAIREASGGSAYSNGVTGSNQGVQFFTVPYDAPAKIFYQCTIHSGMVGNIYIRGAGGQNDNVGITTFTGLIDVNQLKKTSGTLDYLAATHTFNNAAGSSEYLRIDSSGQLSIGAAPSSGLGLLNIKPKSTDDTFIKFRPASDFDGTFDGTAIDNRNSANNANKDLIVRFGKCAIWAGGTEKLRIASAGQLGIGGANYGTAGQVVTSTGNSTGLSWKTPLSVLISSTTVSSDVSSVTFTEALTGAFSTYGIYVVTINGMRLANDDRDLRLRVRTGTNGATLVSSNDYLSMTNNGETFAANSFWRLNYNNIGNEVAGSYIRETFNAIFYFYGFEANKRCRYHGQSTYQNSSGTLVGQFVNGAITDATEVTGLEFFSSSGNINLGKFSLFGVNG